jgi:hypothetical protein
MANKDEIRKVELYNRLHSEGESKRRSVAAATEYKAQKELAGCTFHPETLSPRARSGQPAHIRLTDPNYKRIKEEINEIRKRAYETENCTFQPNLEKYGHILQRNASGRTFDRLYGHAAR